MFRHGFKAWCENTAVGLRARLSLGPTEPLSPITLANWLGIKVLTPIEIDGLSEKDVNILLKQDRESWSAVTLSFGAKSLIILNSSHSPSRQASDLMHEIAHVLLGHQPARIDVTRDGLMLLNTYDADQEEEAAWLASCLLIPREALLHVRQKNNDITKIAREYGVSRKMVAYRLNVTGVDKQIRRGRPGTRS